MSGNTESTSNSIKFAPMPMSALLANLMPFQNPEQSPDASFSSDNDDSFSETVAKKPSPAKKINKDYYTPTVKSKPKDIKAFASEKKFVYNEHDKENNSHDSWAPHQTYPAKENHNNIIQSAHKSINTMACPKSEAKPNADSNSEAKKRSVLMQQNNRNARSQNPPSHVKSTPEMAKVPSSSQKLKSATPKIKSGIRKFTPGSKQSHKKTPQKALTQNRDKVRVELFSEKPSKDEPQCPPPRAEPAPAHVPVPETPLNRKVMPPSYVATPSYPQGVINHSNKVLFKTTCIKDKKYMFIKKLGTGGSSEVYKVLEVGTSCEYAVKCVYLATDPELAQGYINEVRLLRELQNSDRVIRLFDYEYDRNNQFLRMVLEVGETDLSSFLKARGAGLPPALVLHYWEEMLHAVNYIHEHGEQSSLVYRAPAGAAARARAALLGGDAARGQLHPRAW
ncbi:hypothetical protein PYW07_014892 [Mythimna separata]|uniref:Protein kinase domain-containing protein n=1 Tax=Mythimna separata TaxID=271217 RepID=A0AAD7YZM5_MYTSE|nr:hypothetical protein PYW07_014892 [Mythimna separata]